jgi:hypothetical protein
VRIIYGLKSGFTKVSKPLPFLIYHALYRGD